MQGVPLYRPVRRRVSGAPIAAAAVAGLPGWAPIVRGLVDQGYVLVPLTRPRLDPRGGVTVRLVYRRRRDDSVAVIQQVLTGAIPPALQDALAVAFGF